MNDRPSTDAHSLPDMKDKEPTVARRLIRERRPSRTVARASRA
jgi:hypothetical protein